MHGARDPGETHTIRLSSGDTNDTGTGDIINNVTTLPNTVYGGPWTTFNQVVALVPGFYTLSFKSDNPTGNPARGGLFTDMRAFVDIPDQQVSMSNNDTTCTVPVTSTGTTCEFWQPQCDDGVIASWRRVSDGVVRTNAAFWANVPAPQCCAPGGDSGGTASAGNLVQSYPVCAVIGGVPTTLQRVIVTDQSGGAISEQFIGPDGAPVTPAAWNVGSCPVPFQARDTEVVELCDRQANNTIQVFLRRFLFNEAGQVISAINVDADGAPYTPTGTVVACAAGDLDVESHILCDNFTIGPNNVREAFIRTTLYSPAQGGLAVDSSDWELDGVTPRVNLGTVGDCSFTEPTFGYESICYTLTATGATIHAGTKYHQENFPAPGFLVFDSNGVLVNTGAGGYTQVPCIATTTATVSDTRDIELQILCDSSAVPVRFLRRYIYDGEDGSVIGFVNTTLDGTTAFAPVGAVGICSTPVATDFDFTVSTLCDSQGTPFLQRLTFNSSTGAVTSTTNTTLTGAAFVPVGAVGVCANCCPIVMGQGCTNTGSGTYVAIRAANGTISLLDAVTGAPVTGANIIACPTDNVVRTLTSQARLLTNAAPWTPGADVVGTLTSLTITGLSGLWDMVDQNGTALVGLPAGLTLTWTSEDDNVLTGPTSVTPQAGASVVANWTVR